MFSFNFFSSPDSSSKCLANTQCVLLEDEIIICGGNDNKCYSFHTLRRTYKYICSYPSEVKLNGHCVLQWKHNESDSNETKLLSFGGQSKGEAKYTFMMRYKSVWSDGSKSQSEPHSSFNTWVRMPKFNIGSINDDFVGARALIGGANNNLLFITHSPGKIYVVDLNTMERYANITNATLPIEENMDDFRHHCFVPWTAKDERVPNLFIFFCGKTGLLIKFDEANKDFKYEALPTCLNLRDIVFDTYISDYDCIFFFARFKTVWKYSMQDRTWDKCNSTWSEMIKNPCAILSKNNARVHIFGEADEIETPRKHIEINMSQLFEKHELLRMLQKKKGSKRITTKY
ncbi:hypothetical protein RFI_29481 [Reticulomyxa filosa]|uniref:Uncharacterized protein n=1 Tax=Reticulomyxa filosa TaxID=46433 RepID=X6M1A4_RETFI|nr:hypothetical protein RFI_29481 [Reticulomyxa filosa]|eukprot:ETO07908.1 hypothetical protein RFI_29481 [Reticulomyxa filosa]